MATLNSLPAKLTIVILASLAVFFGIYINAHAVSTFIIGQGGTGTTTPSGILYGDNGATTHVNTVTIGSNLTFSGGTLSATGGGGTGLSTTSPVSGSNLLVYSSVGAGSAYGVATTTLAGTGVLSISNSPVLIGASPAVVSLTGGSNGQVLGWLSGAPTWTATSSVAAGTAISISVAGAVTTINNTGVTALAGTANQITSSGATGSLTLSIPTQFNISNASTTNFSANTAAIGGTATTTLATNGEITGNDIASSFLGRITPTRNLVLQTGTTTTWTGTTTGAYIPYVVAPFTGTLRNIRCKNDAGTVGAEIQINGADIAPGFVNASTTVGVTAVTGSNTFTVGDKIAMINGTPATSPTTISCTLATIETP